MVKLKRDIKEAMGLIALAMLLSKQSRIYLSQLYKLLSVKKFFMNHRSFGIFLRTYLLSFNSKLKQLPINLTLKYEIT